MGSICLPLLKEAGMSLWLLQGDDADNPTIARIRSLHSERLASSSFKEGRSQQVGGIGQKKRWKGDRVGILKGGGARNRTMLRPQHRLSTFP